MKPLRCNDVIPNRTEPTVINPCIDTLYIVVRLRIYRRLEDGSDVDVTDSWNSGFEFPDIMDIGIDSSKFLVVADYQSIHT